MWPYVWKHDWKAVHETSSWLALWDHNVWRKVRVSASLITIIINHQDHPHLSSYLVKGKGKGSCLESRLHDNVCSTDFTFPLARWAPMQPATIDPTLDLCTRYPLRLGVIRSLPNTSTHGQHWESNPRPSNFESNALSTGPHAPVNHTFSARSKSKVQMVTSSHHSK